MRKKGEGREKVAKFSSSSRLRTTPLSSILIGKKNEKGRNKMVLTKMVTKERYEDRKLSLSAKILTVYGLALIAVLMYLGISSDWTCFNSENTLILAFVIASYPILGMALTILEVVFGDNGGF